MPAAAGAAVRVAGLALLSVAAALSFDLPVVANAERFVLDVRMAAGAVAVADPADPRVAVVEITERTLERTMRRTPIDRRFLAQLLDRLDAVRPPAIGVDILFDQPSDRDADLGLERVLARMRTPTFLAFADQRPDGERAAAWQERYLRDLLARLDSAAVQPASLRFPVDPDGVVRRLPDPADRPAPMSVQLAGTERRGGLAPSGRMRAADPQAGFPIMVVPAEAVVDAAGAGGAVLLEALSRRIVLVGANLADADRHRTAFSAIAGETMPGVRLHALATAQSADGHQADEAGFLPRLAVSAAMAALAFWLGGRDRRLSAGVALLGIGVLVLWIGCTLLLWSNRNLGPALPVVGPTLAAFAAFAAGIQRSRSMLDAERRFIKTALVHYVPPAVISKLQADPNALGIFGDKREITALFTDIADFTQLAERLEPYLVARLLNEYLEGMTRIVHRHHGMLDKYMGDAVVALWGAPLDDPGQAGRAFDCAVALAKFGAEFADRCIAQGIAFGRTRVGVHKGQAVVGNFGSQERYQYTAIGDTMNSAQRLESANRHFGTQVLVSAMVAVACPDRRVRPVADLVVLGRGSALAVFEPAETMADDALERYRAAYGLMAQGDARCAPLLAALAHERPADAVVAFLAARARQEYYSTRVDLGEK